VILDLSSFLLTGSVTPLKEELAKQMQPMIEWEVIRQSKSPNAAPMVLAKKKGPTHGPFASIYTRNKATIPNRYPISCIDAIFDQLGQA
jgi:hypothetical protein